MGIPFCEVIERMKLYGKLKNDSAVARVLGVTPQALSNYKKRSEMPSNLVVKFAQIHEISMDWLITGQGLIYKRKAEKCLENAEEALVINNRQEIEYIGKLLKILRKSGESPIAVAMKHVIDALSQSREPMNADARDAVISKSAS